MSRVSRVSKVVNSLIVLSLFVSQAWAGRISQDEAAVVANHFMNVASANSNVKKAVPAKRMVLKKAAAEEENLYYVYENADGEGWVIVAANDAVAPILAYSCRLTYANGWASTTNTSRRLKQTA